jgi:hypothetical protein
MRYGDCLVYDSLTLEWQAIGYPWTASDHSSVHSRRTFSGTCVCNNQCQPGLLAAALLVVLEVVSVTVASAGKAILKPTHGMTNSPTSPCQLDTTS